VNTYENLKTKKKLKWLCAMNDFFLKKSNFLSHVASFIGLPSQERFSVK
jgi:hypothetical protein